MMNNNKWFYKHKNLEGGKWHCGFLVGRWKNKISENVNIAGKCNARMRERLSRWNEQQLKIELKRV